jgi:hypothetical protein
MKRFALLLSVLVATAATAPAVAQTVHPTPSSAANYAKVHHVSSLTNPGAQRYKVGTMNGAGCQSGAVANSAQLAVNPINGQAQAAPIISIPLNKGGGSVADATTRAQQAHACAHTR